MTKRTSARKTKAATKLEFDLGWPPERVWQAAVESLLGGDVLHIATADLDPEEGLEIARLAGNAQEMALYILQNEIESLWNGDAIPKRRRASSA